MTFLSSCGVLCNILPEAHVLTGCYTTSAIHLYMGLEKETLMKVITKSPENVSKFVKLSGTDGDAALQQARKLVFLPCMISKVRNTITIMT